MSDKVKIKIKVEFEIEIDKEWYDNEDISIDEIIEIEKTAALEGELLYTLLENNDYTVDIEVK